MESHVWLFSIFFLRFVITLDTNQVLQVPLQRQVATSHLPQEGLLQLWTQTHTHMHQTYVKFIVCLPAAFTNYLWGTQVQRCEYLASVFLLVTDLQVEVGVRRTVPALATSHQLLQPPSSGWIVLLLILYPVRRDRLLIKV